MMIGSVENSANESIPQYPITTATCPTWKLYENPFYNSHHTNHHQHPHHRHCQSNKHFHPLSARKIAPSFWDLTFFRPIMETELEIAGAQIIELKAELEYERKARRKGETMNKILAKELAEERKGREALERVCEELAREISSDKVEIDRIKREIEEERKMLRVAEVLREERVQMKLAEAKILFEEKLLELEGSKMSEPDENPTLKMEQEDKNQEDQATANNLSGKFSRLILGERSCDDNNGADSRESTRAVLSEKSSCNDNHSSVSSVTVENPHIKRGIKGFVEFPRVVRAIGSKSRHWGTKLECQKAQLRILLRQKNPIRSNNVIIS
ncbi:hypothetical protein P3X46_030238 [Hevea brasiliensis]|uniref:Protein BRANCHLESS TRICHOME n=1 Tax=Hevea brasiliensis TaxID=3981 RepID=A0ABQ9KW79_HEVBR|nr:protein BRANCHLESS TRICHOME [Hevea brasiliensis]KAJ9148154.1 hypothetical protein P3X46_030238 [Hevea brasiliensis]